MQYESLLRRQDEAVAVLAQIQGIQASLEDVEVIGREQHAHGLARCAGPAQRRAVGDQRMAAVRIEARRQPDGRSFHGPVIPVRAGLGVVLDGVEILKVRAVVVDDVGRRVEADAGMVGVGRERHACCEETRIRVNQIAHDGEELLLVRRAVTKHVRGGDVHASPDEHQCAADVVSRLLGGVTGRGEGVFHQGAVVRTKLQCQEERQNESGDRQKHATAKNQLCIRHCLGRCLTEKQ